VQVHPGETATDIAGVLHDAGVIRSVAAFVATADRNPDSRLIQPGYYQLPREISARSALDRLLARSPAGMLVYKVSHQVTIPEGTITIDIYRQLAAFTHLPVADFQAAATDPIGLGLPAWWLRRDDGKPTLHPPSIEGFLYPDTYDIPPGATAKTILAMMVDRFLTVTGDLGFADQVQANLHITPYEALVAASIAQVEAVYPQDMAGVSRVLYNRAFGGHFPCACLGLDSEVNYWLRVSGQKAQPSGQLRDRQLHDSKDPYNTHDQPGLPVGPISNPGRDALQGAMNPPKTNAVYFLGIDTAGHVAFADSYPRFCRLVHQAATNGVSIGSCAP
jgi:UPF0755 protein